MTTTPLDIPQIRAAIRTELAIAAGKATQLAAIQFTKSVKELSERSREVGHEIVALQMTICWLKDVPVTPHDLAEFAAGPMFTLDGERVFETLRVAVNDAAAELRVDLTEDITSLYEANLTGEEDND